jgi:hypothetical protein
MTRLHPIWFLALLAVLGPGSTRSFAQGQQPDLDYDTAVAAPAYEADHPAVMFDEAHNNFHTMGGTYKPFADLISHDGYRVEDNRKPFTKDVLAPYRILVIACASGAERRGQGAGLPAFTLAECQAAEAWVKQGGSLLLVTDHFLFGSAAQVMGRAFGIEMSEGQATDPMNSFPGVPARLIFSRENGLLGDHPIVRGRGPSEQLNFVVTYSGQSLKGPRGSVPFLRLADSARERSRVENAVVSAAGRCQGLAMVHGKGRVVVLGEAAVLSAQLFGPDQPAGMNDPGADNRQLALNIMHWLSGLLPADGKAATGQPGSSPRPSGPAPPQGP